MLCQGPSSSHYELFKEIRKITSLGISDFIPPDFFTNFSRINTQCDSPQQKYKHDTRKV
jgi:hypothetical protein